MRSIADLFSRAATARRACACGDVVISHDKLNRRVRRWDCDNCGQNGYGLADGRGSAFPRIVDAARSHTAGHAVCRPYVRATRYPAPFIVAPTDYSWICSEHGFPADDRGVESWPTLQEAYADAYRHAVLEEAKPT